MSNFNKSENLSVEQDPTFPYHPPCMRCQPIIDNASIRFHNSETEIPLQIFEDPELKFGTIEIKIRDEIPINSNHIHLLFTIDSSGSMFDKCIDGRSKMEHIKYTLENMLRIFYENEECNISVHVQSFSTKIKTIINTVSNIHNANLAELISSVSKLKPGGSTNIELALSSATKHISNYREEHYEDELVHIFLTDGDITEGSRNYEELLSLVPKNCYNIFIGYGTHHDSELLLHLAKIKGNEYRFIDALEKAGLVYGEIIHGILYKAIEDVTLIANNAEIYNFLTNSWVSEIEIGNLLSSQRKTFHIRSKTPDSSSVKIYGKTIIKTRQFQTINIYESQLDISTLLTLTNIDLSVYIFRQRTQELLYEARKVSEKFKNNNNWNCDSLEDYNNLTNIHDEKNLIKENLKDFLKIMREFMKNNNLESDSIMKMLCDDIFIAYKTTGTNFGTMYTCARQTSNGREQTYMCTTLTTDENLTHNSHNMRIINPVRLQRQTNYPTVNFSTNTQIFDFINNDEDTIDIDSYIPTQDFLSPFSSDGVITLMREISGNHTIGNIVTDDDDKTEEII